MPYFYQVNSIIAHSAFQLNFFYFEIIVNSHAVMKNNTVSASVHFSKFSPGVTSGKATVQHHSQDTDIDIDMLHESYLYFPSFTLCV